MGSGRPFLTSLLALALVLAMPPAEALAVWSHGPVCEGERDALNARKESLDDCINQTESKVHEGDAAAKEKVTKEVPCESELAKLIDAGKVLNRCMENKIWWMPKAKKVQ